MVKDANKSFEIKSWKNYAHKKMAAFNCNETPGFNPFSIYEWPIRRNSWNQIHEYINL